MARDSILLFVDFSKAFDTVDRRLLMQILYVESKDTTDQHCCNLIGLMLNGTKNEYGTNNFDLSLGFLKEGFFHLFCSMSTWMKRSRARRH